MNHYFYIIIVGFVDSMHHFLTLRFFFFFQKVKLIVILLIAFRIESVWTLNRRRALVKMESKHNFCIETWLLKIILEDVHIDYVTDY